jgi:hypothetical protein
MLDKLLGAYLHVLTFWQDAQVVKAKPVPLSVYNGAAPQVHSSKPLTEPMSPVFRYISTAEQRLADRAFRSFRSEFAFDDANAWNGFEE